MSEAERIARIHFLLTTRGKVSTEQIREEFEVSTPTVRRDVALLRDRLRAPIEYDPAQNAYTYNTALHDPIKPETIFNFPGLWLSEEEAYGFLTLINLCAKIDPSLAMPHITPLQGVLKQMLASRKVPMKGFHKKVAVSLPNLQAGDRGVISSMAHALREERQACVTWVTADGVEHQEDVSLQRFILDSNGWSADMVVEPGGTRQTVPLADFKRCAVQQEFASILEEFKSNPESDLAALKQVYLEMW